MCQPSSVRTDKRWSLRFMGDSKLARTLERGVRLQSWYFSKWQSARDTWIANISLGREGICHFVLENEVTIGLLMSQRFPYLLRTPLPWRFAGQNSSHWITIIEVICRCLYRYLARMHALCPSSSKAVPISAFDPTLCSRTQGVQVLMVNMRMSVRVVLETCSFS